MSFTTRYHDLVVKDDIPSLAKKEKERIKAAIENKLLSQPEHFGKPLRRSLKGYRCLRVGDYRVVYRIEQKIVKIFRIEHRSIVYKRRARFF